MSSTADAARPLEGVRVLDLTTFLSGPYATMILADLGAEVIKLEPPGGDAARHIPPYFVESDSAYYLSVNRNKKSVVVDMKQEAGRETTRELAARCDVLIENFRPGVAAKLGLAYDKIAQVNPGLVWCSLSGFGQEGPYRDHPAYDMIVQALSGGMSMTGEHGGLPVRSGIPLGDLAAGMFSVIGIQAALVERARTGRGREIDIAMLDCQISMLCYQAAYHLIAGVVPGTQGRGHDSIPTYRAFIAGDAASVVVCANTERMWEEMATELDLAHLLEDARFKTNRERHANREALWPLLDEAFARHPAQHWVDRFRARSIPVGLVNTLEQAFRDPQVLHRNMVVEMQRDGHAIRVAGNPVKFAGTREAAPAYPPALGADTAAVLTSVLGWSEEKLASLLQQGAIAGPAVTAKQQAA